MNLTPLSYGSSISPSLFRGDGGEGMNRMVHTKGGGVKGRSQNEDTRIPS
jgi:hypothetical protein